MSNMIVKGALALAVAALLGLFGLDHHRRGCAKRQQNVGRKGLYDVIGHTMGQRRTGSEVV